MKRFSSLLIFLLLTVSAFSQSIKVYPVGSTQIAVDDGTGLSVLSSNNVSWYFGPDDIQLQTGTRPTRFLKAAQFQKQDGSVYGTTTQLARLAWLSALQAVGQAVSSGGSTGTVVLANTLSDTDASKALAAPMGKVMADSNNAQRVDINAARSIAQNALNSAGQKAPTASPTFTGTPTAPTALSTNNSTQLATTSFVITVLKGYMRDSLSLYTDSTQFVYNLTKGLQIRPSVLGASGNASGWQTSGTITYNTTGSVGIGTNAPNKLLHVAGAAQFDAIHLTGANASETNSVLIRRLAGVGVQIGGVTFSDNPEMSTQGNLNMTWGGNLFMKVGGKAWFFHTNGYLGVNNDTTTPTAYFDVNNTSGYDGLRLRNTYTPTSTSDANGQVGSLAWDASFIYVKTASGWKRTALSTF